MTLKIITVIGARPQFIKAAPISKAFKNIGSIEEILVHTGQHYDAAMSDIFFDELEIPAPKYNLEVGSGTHAVQTAEILKRLEAVLLEEKPDMVLIYGDTNSTIAGALAAAKLHIPVAHVEAGLRSFNRRMPEEINRIVADVLASILFAPTKTAVDNLRNEGVSRNVYISGDVMYDAAVQFGQKAKAQSRILDQLKLTSKSYLLATIHRAENTDDPTRLQNIFSAFDQIAAEMPVILPLHPRTRKLLTQYHLQDLLNKVNIIEPVGFLDMVNLESNARLIVTDSGGVQKEAYFHKVPCVTLRDETEWIETVNAGWNTLADVSSADAIAATIHSTMSCSVERKAIDEYGDGNAASEIVSTILTYLTTTTH
jgi:UDP-GlcNAc3NAcA epimerase